MAAVFHQSSFFRFLYSVGRHSVCRLNTRQKYWGLLKPARADASVTPLSQSRRYSLAFAILSIVMYWEQPIPKRSANNFLRYLELIPSSPANSSRLISSSRLPCIFLSASSSLPRQPSHKPVFFLYAAGQHGKQLQHGEIKLRFSIAVIPYFFISPLYAFQQAA